MRRCPEYLNGRGSEPYRARKQFVVLGELNLVHPAAIVNLAWLICLLFATSGPWAVAFQHDPTLPSLKYNENGPKHTLQVNSDHDSTLVALEDAQEGKKQRLNIRVVDIKRGNDAEHCGIPSKRACLTAAYAAAMCASDSITTALNPCIVVLQAQSIAITKGPLVRLFPNVILDGRLTETVMNEIGTIPGNERTSKAQENARESTSKPLSATATILCSKVRGQDNKEGPASFSGPAVEVLPGNAANGYGAIVRHVSIKNCHARYGGAILSVRTPLEIQNVVIQGCSAALGGGAIFWIVVRPVLQDVQITSSTSPFGGDIASTPINIAAYKNQGSIPTISLKPGSFLPEFNAELLDAYNTLASTDDWSVVVVNLALDKNMPALQGSPTAVPELVGSTKASCSKGVATFSGSIQIKCQPGFIGQLIATAAENANNVNKLQYPSTYFAGGVIMKVHCTECPVGSPFIGGVCSKCPHGQFSLHPSHDPKAACMACPPGASCPGGDQLIAQVGFKVLRTSQLSTDLRKPTMFIFNVVKCKIRSACPSGPYGTQCASHYKGETCDECNTGYSLCNGECTKGTCWSMVFNFFAAAMSAFMIMFLIFRAAIMAGVVDSSISTVGGDDLLVAVRASKGYRSKRSKDSIDFEESGLRSRIRVKKQVAIDSNKYLTTHQEKDRPANMDPKKMALPSGQVQEQVPDEKISGKTVLELGQKLKKAVKSAANPGRRLFQHVASGNKQWSYEALPSSGFDDNQDPSTATRPGASEVISAQNMYDQAATSSRQSPRQTELLAGSSSGSEEWLLNKAPADQPSPPVPDSAIDSDDEAGDFVVDLNG